MSQSRFNPQITYFRRDKLPEVFVSIFIAGIFFPKRMFAGLPADAGWKGSAILLAMYLAVPTLMMTTTFGTLIPTIAPGFFSGLIAILLIAPVSLAIGVGTSWLWAAYLSWATRIYTGKHVSRERMFQICAYSGPPFAIAWGPYLGPVMAGWNLLLNWKGLRHAAGIGWFTGLWIILSGILILALIVVVLALLVAWMLPENMQMLIETAEVLMHLRGL